VESFYFSNSNFFLRKLSLKFEEDEIEQILENEINLEEERSILFNPPISPILSSSLEMSNNNNDDSSISETIITLLDEQDDLGDRLLIIQLLFKAYFHAGKILGQFVVTPLCPSPNGQVILLRNMVEHYESLSTFISTSKRYFKVNHGIYEGGDGVIGEEEAEIVQQMKDILPLKLEHIMQFQMRK